MDIQRPPRKSGAQNSKGSEIVKEDMLISGDKATIGKKSLVLKLYDHFRTVTKLSCER